MDKAELRIQKRKLRKGLSVFRILNYSNRIYEALLLEPAYQEADVILAYMSFSSEVDTHFLIEGALKAGKRVAIPKCENHKALRFYYITGKEQTAPGAFGILEPTRGSMKRPALPVSSHTPIVHMTTLNTRLNIIRYITASTEPSVSISMKGTPRNPQLEKTEELLPEGTDVPAQVVLTEVRRYSREKECV